MRVGLQPMGRSKVKDIEVAQGEGQDIGIHRE